VEDPSYLPIKSGTDIWTASRVDKIYMALKKPVATYAAKVWTLNKDIAKRLAVLRRMSGGINVD
jgi:threonine aldolase